MGRTNPDYDDAVAEIESLVERVGELRDHPAVSNHAAEDYLDEAADGLVYAGFAVRSGKREAAEE